MWSADKWLILHLVSKAICYTLLLKDYIEILPSDIHMLSPFDNIRHFNALLLVVARFSKFDLALVKFKLEIDKMETSDQNNIKKE